MTHNLAGRWVTLPELLVTGSEVVVDDFEDVALWPATTGSRAANTTQYRTGSQSVKVTTPSGSTADVRFTGVPIDLSAVERFALDIYAHDAVADYATGAFIDFCTDGTLANAYRFAGSLSYHYTTGLWTTLVVRKASLTNIGTPGSWASIAAIRLRFTGAADKTPSLSFDALRAYTGSQSALMLSFDDGLEEVIDNAFPVLRAHGVRASVFPMASGVGTAGYVTWAELRTLQTAGWMVGNHTMENVALTTLSAAAQLATITDAHDASVAEGITPTVLAFVGGTWNVDTMTAMATLGYGCGRSFFQFATTARVPMMPPADIRRLETWEVTSSQTVAQVKTRLDEAIANGTIAAFGFHAIGGSGEWTAAQLDEFLVYWETLRAQCPAITVGELHALMDADTTVVV